MKNKILSLIKEYNNDSKSTSQKAEEEILSYCTQVTEKLIKLGGSDLFGVEWDDFYSYFDKIDYITPSTIYLIYRNDYNGDEYIVHFLIEWFEIDYEKFWKTQKEKNIAKCHSEIKLLMQRIALYNREIEEWKSKEMPKID